MSEWNFVKLGSLAHFKNGLNFSKDSWGKGVKIIGVSDFKDYLYPKYETLAEINPNGVVRKGDYLEDDDILFVRSNGNRLLIGRSLHIRNLTEKVSHSGFTIRLRFTSPSVYVPFYAHLLRSSLIRSTLSLHGGGTNINNLNQEILSDLAVPVPPLPTQKKIAAVLFAYDDLIENNDRRITLLEKMAEEIYREWFVRLRFPGFDRATFHKGIPEGWEVGRIDSLGQVKTGKTPSTLNANYYGGEIPFIKTPDMHGNMFLLETEEHITEDGLKSQPSQIIPANSICVSCIGTAGVTSISTEKCSTNQQINSLILDNQDDLECAYFSVRSLKESLEIFGATGTTMVNVSKGKFCGLKILIPPRNIRNHFSGLFSSSFESIKILAKQNINLKQTRDRLLTRLISGKLSVEDLDIQFPPSMTTDS